MRDPSGLKEYELKQEGASIIKMDNIPPFDIQDYDLMDSKEFREYVKTIKRIARGSFEYRGMINYLRENMDMNKCSFYENVNNIDTFKIKIEVHHHPFTLEDIIVIVYNKRLFYHECLDDEMVAKEVMYLHYTLMIGLIPLSVTVHELVHNQYLFIPNNKVMGKYQDFYNMYKDFMTPEILDTYERTIKFSETYNESERMHLLDRRYIYLDLTGEYSLPSYKSIVDAMNDKIRELKATPDIRTDMMTPKKKKVVSFVD